LATSGTDRDLKIYEVESGKLKATIDSKEAGFSGKTGFNAFSFSPDGTLLQNPENAVFPTRFSTDGRLLATGGKNDVGFVWQIGRNW
jgi:hypothetical protein